MTDKYPKVFVLLDGHCSQVKMNGCSEASGTVALILTERRKILVDCGDPWNGACVIQGSLIYHSFILFFENYIRIKCFEKFYGDSKH